MKGVGNYGTINGSNGELSPSINRLKNQISFSSRSASSLGMLSQISEIGSEAIGAGAAIADDARQGGSNGDAPHYGPGFPYGSWNDTTQLSENITGLKRGRNSNEKLFSDVQVCIYRMLTFLILFFQFEFFALSSIKLLYLEWRARKSSSHTITSLELAKNFIRDGWYGEVASVP